MTESKASQQIKEANQSMVSGDRRPRGGAPPPLGRATTDCACAARGEAGRNGRRLSGWPVPPWALRPKRELPCHPWLQECHPEWACPKEHRSCPREQEPPCRPWLRECRPEWACPREHRSCPKDYRRPPRGSCRKAWCRAGACRRPSSFCRVGRSSPRGL